MAADPYKVAWQREVQARKVAEKLLDEKTREVQTSLNILTKKVQELDAKNKELESTNEILNQTRDHLIQSEKMASMGQLSAGVAHEINNPLSFIKGNLEVLESYVKTYQTMLESYRKTESHLPEELVKGLHEAYRNLDMDFVENDIAAMLQESIVGVDRICEIVKDLQSYNRREKAEATLGDINESMEAAIKIATKKFSTGVELKQDLKALPSTYCYPNQLIQLFVNLIINAEHAIKKVDQTKVKGLVQVSSHFENSKFIIVVRDNGCGIPQQNMENLFEPFFTTKPPGEGTGLGLSVAYNIVKHHKGEMFVQSQEGKGTRFVVELPLIESLKNESH